jgi:hypothetical protein
MALPKYIVATKTIPYKVEHILEDMATEPDFDISKVTIDDLIAYLDLEISDDFGINEPTPEFTFEYEENN